MNCINSCVLSTSFYTLWMLGCHPVSGCLELLGEKKKKKNKRPVSSFSIMFICSAVWWLKTMWKTISCKQSSEIIWLVEEWYCQAPLLDIIEPLKWGSAAGCVLACSTWLFPRCDFVARQTVWIKWAIFTALICLLEKKNNPKQNTASIFCAICFIRATLPNKWLLYAFAQRFAS